jgi:hypothetical protein
MQFFRIDFQTPTIFQGQFAKNILFTTIQKTPLFETSQFYQHFGLLSHLWGFRNFWSPIFSDVLIFINKILHFTIFETFWIVIIYKSCFLVI